MAYLVEIRAGGPDEAVLVVEADAQLISEDDLVMASGAGGKAVQRLATTLDAALAGLQPSLQRVVTALQELAPSETTVEFGIKIGGETGAVIAKGTSEANFTVSMTWR